MRNISIGLEVGEGRRIIDDAKNLGLRLSYYLTTDYANIIFNCYEAILIKDAIQLVIMAHDIHTDREEEYFIRIKRPYEILIKERR